MRSATFDMVGMALMALATVFTVGVGITWAYLRETRGGSRTSDLEKRPTVLAAAPSDEKPSVGIHR